MRLCRHCKSEAMWASLAAMAIHGLHLDTAEIALAATKHGASSGIGRAIAKAFHDQGALVAVGARRLERLEALCLELDPASKGTAVPVQTDVTDAASVKP